MYKFPASLRSDFSDCRFARIKCHFASESVPISSEYKPESLLAKKGPGKEAKLCYGAHALMENRNGLLVDLKITQATGTAEREAAEEMIKRQRRKGVKVKSLGADKGYDTHGFVGFLRRRKIVPHVAANTKRKGGLAIDDRTTRHQSYTISQRIRKRIE